MAETHDTDHGAGAPGGFAPPPAFLEKMGRLKTAIALGTPDRVPVCLMFDAFAAHTMGIKMSEYSVDADIAGQAALATLEKLGDVDAIQFATILPKLLGMIWLTPVKIAGRDLPEGSLWQMDEQMRMHRDDYDDILQKGWGAWVGGYIGRYLQEEAAAAGAIMQAGPRWAGACMQKGYVAFVTANVTIPFEPLSGARSIKEFMLDLFQQPDKVQAVMDVYMAETREQVRHMVRAIGPYGYQVGSWRSAPEFLSPRLWNRFVWPYMKELVEIVVEEGGTPILHYDANWDREIERLLELPKAKCVLTTDGKTDFFRASKILAGHMCMMGDVPPALLTWGPWIRSRSTASGCSPRWGRAGSSWPRAALLRRMPSLRTSKPWSNP